MKYPSLAKPPAFVQENIKKNLRQIIRNKVTGIRCYGKLLTFNVEEKI
jgi:hypothetical protein